MNRRSRHARRSALVAAVIGLAIVPLSATAFGLFSHSAPSPTSAGGGAAAQTAAVVRQALNEQRYVDAGSLLDRASIDGVTSPELTVLTGEFYLARGRFADALVAFRSVGNAPAQRPPVLQGEGIALSMLGRSDEAFASLKAATLLDKSLWRAWNALGREYDLRRDWTNAATAYEAALSAPGAKLAVVLNNRGYSRLLRDRPAEAANDFIAALAKDPGMAAARTNLRIALAWQGAYARAAVTGAGDDRAAVLNNVGLAAALRGDYREAEKYLNEAMTAKGQFYDRAAENLQLAHGLAERRQTASITGPAVVH